MNLREAAQQALEALEYYEHIGIDWCYADKEAITALRTALAEHYCDTHCTWADHADGCVRSEQRTEPEQEPVAWIEHGLVEAPDGLVWEKGSFGYYTPLYTHPPRREWRGLTEEEKRECAQAMDAEPLAEGWPELVKFARAIEAALKEKNHE